MPLFLIFLIFEQIDKLRRVLTPTIPIYPSPPTSSFPTLHIIPKDFLRQVLVKLKEHSIDITSIHLHGGAASYVLVNDSDFIYRDIDILFHVKTPLSSQQQTTLFSSNNQPYLCDVWTIIKYIVSLCLIEYIPNALICTQYFISSVIDTYTKKNIKISSEQDSWALLSLQNLLGQNLELKFVENLKRQWQFSVDSFQIDLKTLLLEKSIIPQSITTKIQTKSLNINAINGLTIINKNQNNEENTNSGPLEFGFFTPSSSPDIINNKDNIQYQTLATITTIQTSTESRSRSPKLSKSTVVVDDNDDQSNSSIQFQISINEEDDDDGIEADAGDSTNEDDDQVFRTPIEADSPTSIEISLSPKIEVTSLYKDLHQALYHLNNKLIATYEPETMRGGGLLKYCDLLARNYKLYDIGIMIHMQRYMCSRFFIDYKTIREQLHVIAQYVSTHYLSSSLISNLYTLSNSNEVFHCHSYEKTQIINSKYNSQQIDQIDLINARICLLFFEQLLSIIQQSTVCLTHEDRELLLYNIHILKEHYHYEYEHLFREDSHHHQKYHVYNHQHYCINSSTNSSRSVGLFYYFS